jgi:hypothetical protein
MEQAPAQIPLPSLLRSKRFLQRLIAERPERRRSPGMAGELAKYGVGTRKVDWVYYADADFLRAGELLAQSGIPLQAPQPTVVPVAEAAASAVPLKRRAADLVAIAPLNGAVAVPPGTQFLAMSFGDAVELPHEVIVVCQTMRSLQRAARWPWVAAQLRGRAALAVYRGGVGSTGFQVFAADSLLQSSHAPVLALVDLDATGLKLATQFPRLEALCHPGRDALAQFLWSLHNKGMPSLRNDLVLDATRIEPVAATWRMLKEFDRGIPLDALARLAERST